MVTWLAEIRPDLCCSDQWSTNAAVVSLLGECKNVKELQRVSKILNQKNCKIKENTGTSVQKYLNRINRNVFLPRSPHL